MNYSILLIEDDPEIRQLLSIFLRKEGYLVNAVATGEEGILIFFKQNFHLVLLDMMLPKMGGEDVLRKIRSHSSVPIVIISALSDELIQLDAFENSCDDYVVKPFSMSILSHKIASLIRRVYKNEQKKLHYKDIVIHNEEYELYEDGHLIDLTVKEFEILLTMVQNQGKVYSREELLNIVWGYDYYGDMRNIDVHIKNIRKKMNENIIITVKGIGYKVARL